MIFVRRAAIVACLLFLSSCTTTPYQDLISGFAEAVSQTQTALLNLDELNTEIERARQIEDKKDLKLNECKVLTGCDFAGIEKYQSPIESPLLYMAKLVAYTKGLVNLAAAKDTAAITKASSQIDDAAQSSVKSFANQIKAATMINASFGLVDAIANQIIQQERLTQLRAMILKYRTTIEGTIDSVADRAYDMQVKVVGAETTIYINQEVANFNAAPDTERPELARRLIRHQQRLNELAKTDIRTPFKALKKAHLALIDALKDPDKSSPDVASAIQDFLSKAQTLNSAIQKGD